MGKGEEQDAKSKFKHILWRGKEGDKALWLRLCKIRLEHGIMPSFIIRKAVEEYLERHKELEAKV